MKFGKAIDFENIIEILPFGVLYLEGYKIIYLNSAAEQIIGLSREKVCKLPFNKLSFNQNVVVSYEKILKVGKSARLYEEEFVDYFGNKFLLNFYFVPVSSKNSGYIVILEDCSFLKEIEKKQVDYSNIERLSILFVSMAHEIKNPLGVIKGIVQLIERAPSNFDKEAFDIILSEINRIEKIIQELLNYSSPQRINEEPVNVHMLLDKGIKNLVNLIKEKSVSIIKEYDTTLPDIIADPECLYRAFFNVIKNAIEACPINGKVVISSKINIEHKSITEHGEVNFMMIEITDNGAGISDEDMKKIFTPFFSTKKGGTGLGLVYVQKVILDHNGFITVKSTPKVGTKVTIYLPMKVKL